MKLISLILFLSLSIQSLFAQNDCTGHPLFNTLANHSLSSCENKEFDKLKIYKDDKTQGYIIEEKEGTYIKVSYSFDGDFSARPSPTQIYQNYANAITKGNGQILRNSNNGLFGKLKKGDETYWIKVYTDGSGWYWLESVKESSMRQDIVFTANEIKSTLASEGKVSFYGIYFDVGKAVLKVESQPTLKALAAFLKANPTVTVFVVGHTDNTGDFNNNLALSKERANSVVTELITNYGINKTQVTAQGVGSLAPVATNESEEGKAKNRRVEIVKK